MLVVLDVDDDNVPLPPPVRVDRTVPVVVEEEEEERFDFDEETEEAAEEVEDPVCCCICFSFHAGTLTVEAVEDVDEVLFNEEDVVVVDDAADDIEVPCCCFSFHAGILAVEDEGLVEVYVVVADALDGDTALDCVVEGEEVDDDDGDAVGCVCFNFQAGIEVAVVPEEEVVLAVPDSELLITLSLFEPVFVLCCCNFNFQAGTAADGGVFVLFTIVVVVGEEEEEEGTPLFVPEVVDKKDVFTFPGVTEASSVVDLRTQGGTGF